MGHYRYFIALLALPTVSLFSCLFGGTFQQSGIKFLTLDEIQVKHDSLVINNITVTAEEAWLGGHKVNIQCTAKNKGRDDLNYSLYVALYGSEGKLVSCFELEPFMNIHEPGKLEQLEDSGLVVEGEEIESVDIRLITETI